MKVAEALEKENISVEVVDPRTLQPLDEELIFGSVQKTNRVVIVEEAWGFASLGAQISDRIQSACFDYLDAPVTRVTNEFVPMPYNEDQEERTMPSEDRITKAIKDVLYL